MFGVVAGKGIRKLDGLRGRMGRLGPELPPDEAREATGLPFGHVGILAERLGAVEARILAWRRSSEAGQRLASAPGVGTMAATALAAATGDGRHRGRQAQGTAGGFDQRGTSPPGPG